MRTLVVLSILIASLQAFANKSLIDKISAVFDDKVISLSMVSRFQNTIGQRRTIAPFMFNQNKLSLSEAQNKLIETFLIREGLKEIGIIISDTVVEDNINRRQKGLGIGRKQLVQQLESFKISFDEYFEITREIIEYQQFVAQIIKPLISITDQQIKNSFIKANKNKKTISFSFNLLKYSVSGKNPPQNFRQKIIQLRKTEIKDSSLKNLNITDLGNISEESLASELKKALRGLQENDLSQPVYWNNSWNIFFVEKKDLIQSDAFLAQKKKLQAILESEELEKIQTTWIEREKNKHYIKYF